MPTQKLKSAHKVLGWSTATLGLLSLLIAGTTLYKSGSVQAILVKQVEVYPWVVLDPEKVMSGATVPANSHVVFHLPEGFTRISRETMLGLEGKTVRYWGYCFPQNYDPENVDKRRGFPGLIFMSEKERAFRAAEEALNRPRFRTSNLPTTQAEADAMAKPVRTDIVHQVEVFYPSTMCYIMTESELAIGLDLDGDRLNTKLEKELGTNPSAPDSDSDCIIDGIEYKTNTMPTVRDTDGDALVDGIEDSDCDGRVDPGETNPRDRDSDKDKLCDGICRVRLKRQFLFIGEDKDLNGAVDSGELDPTKWDSNDDGVGDYLEMTQCIAAGETDCP